MQKFALFCSHERRRGLVACRRVRGRRARRHRGACTLASSFHTRPSCPRSFITVDVWRRYIETARHLLQPSGGVVILTTVIENAGLLAETLGATPHTYLPSIPNLPYQYALFTNFSSAALDRPNPEVPHDPAAFVAAAAAAAAAPPANAEAPVTGAGHSYDFEAMLDAELRRQAQS